jgi:DNA ligase-1
VTEHTPFQALARLCEALEATTKRNEKKALIRAFLLRLGAGEVAPALAFLTGRVFPDADDRVLDVGGRTVWRLDQGRKQALLDSTPLTIPAVSRLFAEVAQVRGQRSRRRKEELIERLLSQATPLERKYLIRLILGEMRIGVVDGVALEATAEAASVDASLVRRAAMLLGDLGQVAELALTQGAAGLRGVRVTLFTPVKPMLATMAYDVAEVLSAQGGSMGFEYKFDGARVQLHLQGGDVKVFSRRLTDVTPSVPEVVEAAKTQITAETALLDGEVVAYGEEGRPLPFQDLMRRFRRIHRVDALMETVPLRLYLFDVLLLNGEMLIDHPYQERWRRLAAVCEPTLLADRLVTDCVAKAQAFLNAAVTHGHEGLVAKALHSRYTPGTRGRQWFKIKPVETLDLVITAADWGYGRRTGWLSNYHLAARNAATGEYWSVGKTFKGLTDEEFQAMTRRLQQIAARETRYTVYVTPRIVVEVAFNEIQRSPQYPSGFALRFARITRIREDKGPEDADTLDRLQALYEQQFTYKSRLHLEDVV